MNKKQAGDRLMIAEMYRESGHFVTAIDILEDDWPGELKKPVKQILERARKKDQVVFQLKL